MDADAREMYEFARDIERAGRDLSTTLPQAVETAAREVKDEYASELEGDVGKRLRRAPQSIDYDVRALGGLVGFGLASGYMAEIGPNLGRSQGSMAGWFEDGSVRGVPATRPAERTARGAIREFEGGIQRAIDDANRGIA